MCANSGVVFFFLNWPVGPESFRLYFLLPIVKLRTLTWVEQIFVNPLVPLQALLSLCRIQQVTSVVIDSLYLCSWFHCCLDSSSGLLAQIDINHNVKILMTIALDEIVSELENKTEKRKQELQIVQSRKITQ